MYRIRTKVILVSKFNFGINLSTNKIPDVCPLMHKINGYGFTHFTAIFALLYLITTANKIVYIYQKYGAY